MRSWVHICLINYFRILIASKQHFPHGVKLLPTTVRKKNAIHIQSGSIGILNTSNVLHRWLDLNSTVEANRLSTIWNLFWSASCTFALKPIFQIESSDLNRVLKDNMIHIKLFWIYVSTIFILAKMISQSCILSTINREFEHKRTHFTTQINILFDICFYH